MRGQEYIREDREYSGIATTGLYRWLSECNVQCGIGPNLAVYQIRPSCGIHTVPSWSSNLSLVLFPICPLSCAQSFLCVLPNQFHMLFRICPLCCAKSLPYILPSCPLCCVQYDPCVVSNVTLVVFPISSAWCAISIPCSDYVL